MAPQITLNPSNAVSKVMILSGLFQGRYSNSLKTTLHGWLVKLLWRGTLRLPVVSVTSPMAPIAVCLTVDSGVI